MLTCPSPAVIARSVNDGPNVLVTRARRPVAGSSLNTNPPDEVPNGEVATSSAVVSPIDWPICLAPSGLASWTSVCSIVSPSTVVTFCAHTGEAQASVSSMTATGSERLMVIPGGEAV